MFWCGAALLGPSAEPAVHQHAATGRDGHSRREHEDLDAADQEDGEESQSGGALRGLVPGGSVLIVHIADDHRDEESRQSTTNMTPDVDVGSHGAHHHHRKQHEEDPENGLLAMRTHDVP